MCGSTFLRYNNPSINDVICGALSFQTGAHEDARTAPRPRVDARRDDPHPLRHAHRLADRARQVAADLPELVSRESTQPHLQYIRLI